MKKLVLLILLVSTSCMPYFNDDIEYSIDPRMECFVKSFYDRAEKAGLDVQRGYNLVVTTMPHDQMNSPEDGTYRYGFSRDMGHQRVVVLDEQLINTDLCYRTKKDSLWIECVIYHELGHSIFNRKHETGLVIMSQDEWSRAYYSQDDSIRSVMRDQFFK